MYPLQIYNNTLKDVIQYNYVFNAMIYFYLKSLLLYYAMIFQLKKIKLTVKMSFLDCKNVFFNCKNVFFKTQIPRFYTVFSAP